MSANQSNQENPANMPPSPSGAPPSGGRPVKPRLLQIKRKTMVGSSTMCITLTGDDLLDFVSDAFDDHVKLFFPLPGEDKPFVPKVGPNGPIFPENFVPPPARDYTPKRHDPASNELDIDIVLHGDGPGASWARNAAVGSYVGLGGPRGSFYLPESLDWLLLIGDETALPAISRRLAEAGADEKLWVIAEVDSLSDQRVFSSRADVSVRWVFRQQSADGLQQAIREQVLPAGNGYVWAAGELKAIRAIRQYFVTERGMDKSSIRAASYWKAGESGFHEPVND